MTDSRSRARILDGVRSALTHRTPTEHPGAFHGGRPGDADGPGDPVAGFVRTFEAAGGEVAAVADAGALGAWWTAFAADFTSAAVGSGVPGDLASVLPTASPAQADVGLSAARGAVAETGSLILGAEDGREVQLLPPTHVVVVEAGHVHATLRDALLAMKDTLPSGIGLHSGPSKSADIGQILVKGVHGPGRVVAVVVGP